MSNYLGKDFHARPILQLTLGIGSITLHATSHCLKAGVVALEVVIEPHTSEGYSYCVFLLDVLYDHMLSSLPHGLFGKQEHGTELKRCIVIREDRYGEKVGLRRTLHF